MGEHWNTSHLIQRLAEQRAVDMAQARSAPDDGDLSGEGRIVESVACADGAFTQVETQPETRTAEIDVPTCCGKGDVAACL